MFNPILITAIVIFIVLLLLWLERGRLIRVSTLQGLQSAGAKNLFKAIHMYIYGRWPKQYIGFLQKKLPGLSPTGKLKLANAYHSKVLTHEAARNIITLNRNIPMTDLEQVIPYQTARKILLEYPLDIVVIECPCRKVATNDCQPSQVCMVIGKPFAQFALDHSAGAKRINQDEALELLEIVHQKGWVHTAWFKDACLDRFYVICNCCKCCCGGIKAMVKYGVPMIAPSGYSAVIEKEKCIECGVCEKVCPFEAVEENKINREKCMGCEACATKCPQKAIKIARDESKGEPLDLKAWSEKVQ